MEKEEKKIEAAAEAGESEFSDAEVEQPAVEEPEPKAEEKPAEEKTEKQEPGKSEKKEQVAYTYDDSNLANIEAARAGFLKSYSSLRKWSFFPTIALIAVILAAFIVPNSIPGVDPNVSLWISIAVVAVVIVVLLVLSYFKRKKTNVMMKDYFNKFYTYTDEYVFHGTGVTNLQGNIDSKLTREEFEECGLYKDIFSVGSRASLLFNYGGKKCGIADAAAQVRGQKSAVTVFVGKFFRAPNTYKGEPLVIYLKGNDRALPPTGVDDMDVITEDKTMIVRGNDLAKKSFTKKIKDAVKAFKTDDTLVDLTIKIEEGKTFVLLGYEDTLMILPMEKPFNPGPTAHYRDDMKKVFALVDTIDGIGRGKKPGEESEEEDGPAPTKEPEAAKEGTDDSTAAESESKGSDPLPGEAPKGE